MAATAKRARSASAQESDRRKISVSLDVLTHAKLHAKCALLQCSITTFVEEIIQGAVKSMVIMDRAGGKPLGPPAGAEPPTPEVSDGTSSQP
jgi:hypothetical protein